MAISFTVFWIHSAQLFESTGRHTGDTRLLDDVSARDLSQQWNAHAGTYASITHALHDRLIYEYKQINE
jgi:hypothetical protein